MHGMFRANGECGYVKKPDFVMNDEQIFDPKAKLTVKKTLKVSAFLSFSQSLKLKGLLYDISSLIQKTLIRCIVSLGR